MEVIQKIIAFQIEEALMLLLPGNMLVTPSYYIVVYRVTILVVLEVVLTSKSKLRFSLNSL